MSYELDFEQIGDHYYLIYECTNPDCGLVYSGYDPSEEGYACEECGAPLAIAFGDDDDG